MAKKAPSYFNPFICFVACQCQVQALRKAIAHSTAQQASEILYLQNCRATTTSQILHIVFMYTETNYVAVAIIV